MKFPRTKVCLLALAFLAISTHRLPAPIREEATPAPTPKRSAKPSKPKTDESRQTKPNRSVFAQFEGIWSGTVTTTATATLLFSSSASGSAPVTIRVSKTGIVNYASEQPVQGFLSPDGRKLSWYIQKKISDMTWRQNCSLQLVGSNVAAYSDTNKTDGAIADVSGNSTGTMYRR